MSRRYVPSRITIRALIEASKCGDEDAMSSLMDKVRDDIGKVVNANLSNWQHYDLVVHHIAVRIFIYIQRFHLSDDTSSDSACLEYFRRWATNLARNWTRSVNRFGPLVASERYLIPGWAMPEGKKVRRGHLSMMATESCAQRLDDESSEQRLERIAYHAMHDGKGRMV